MSLTEKARPGAFLLDEPSTYLSREVVTVTVPDGGLEAGAVLGIITASGKHIPYDNAETDGREDAASILFDTIANATGSPVDHTATVVMRLAAVRRADLKYLAGTSAGDKTAAETDLATAHVIARD